MATAFDRLSELMPGSSPRTKLPQMSGRGWAAGMGEEPKASWRARHWGGVVERGGVGQHGDALAAGGVLLEDRRGDAGALFAKDQVIAVAVGGVAVDGRRPLGEQVQPPGFAGLGVAPHEVLPAAVGLHRKVVPVVHAGAFEQGIAELKAQRAHKVQARPGHDAGAADVPGVRGDLGLEEDDVEHGAYLAFVQAQWRARNRSGTLSSVSSRCTSQLPAAWATS